jgi:hypothetical protein
MGSLDPVPPASNSLPIALWKGTRSSVTKYPLCNFVSYQSLSPSLSSFISHLSSVSIPKTIKDALSDPIWLTTMELKIEALFLGTCSSSSYQRAYWLQMGMHCQI